MNLAGHPFRPSDLARHDCAAFACKSEKHELVAAARFPAQFKTIPRKPTHRITLTRTGDLASGLNAKNLLQEQSMDLSLRLTGEALSKKASVDSG